jgi:uncharacterized protein YlzI (FlbEa/FlbD family)
MHKMLLIMYFKITDLLGKSYLSSLVPESVDNVTPYNLRNDPSTILQLVSGTKYMLKSEMQIAMTHSRANSIISIVSSLYYHGCLPTSYTNV